MSPKTESDSQSGAAEGSSSPDTLTVRLQSGYLPKRVIPRRHPGRIVAAVILAIIAAIVVQAAITQPGFGWPIFAEYFFNSRILAGVVTTLWLTAAVMLLGVIVGVLIAVMERSSNPLLVRSAQLYVWAFRAVPTLVQLLLWFNLAFLFPQLVLGVPFTDISFWSVDTNSVMTPILAALLGLGLSEGAYMAEIVRAGLNSVDKGQQEAASALGMAPRSIFWKVILPQAIRTIVPPTGNQVIGMLKYTSLASVISVTELLFTAQQIYAVNFQTIPLLLVATAWYMILATVLQIIQVQIERRFNRGVAGVARPSKTRRSTKNR